jgi:esterase/lipase superfamily enzyme
LKTIGSLHFAATILAACGTLDDADAPAPVTSLLLRGQPATSAAETDVKFITDRSAGVLGTFGDRWNPSLTCGTVAVRVPSNRTPGDSGRWRVESLGGKAFPNTIVGSVSDSADCTASESINGFASEIATEARRAPQHDVFVFVQGFDMTFNSAGQTIAQLAHDTGFDGVPVVFSWSSAGRFFQYIDDSEKVTLAVPRLARFLKDLAAEPGIEHVHLIAHSNGSYLTLAALASIADAGNDSPVIDELILAAPDVQMALLSPLLTIDQRFARHITIYVSRGDLALRASAFLHADDAGRVGNQPAGFRSLMGPDVIDVTDAPTDPFGHNYFRNSLPVVHDIGEVLMKVPLQDRSGNGIAAVSCDMDAVKFCKLIVPAKSKMPRSASLSERRSSISR